MSLMTYKEKLKTGENVTDGSTQRQTYADAELVERVKKGDNTAFDILVKKYQNKVISLVGRYVKDPMIAQDVSQEAFIKAYRAIGNFRGDSAFYTWIYRIAINTAKNYLVAQSRRVPNHGFDASEAEQYDSGDLLRDQTTPLDLIATEEIKKVIFDTIENLPDDLRIAITLREIEGMSYEDISAAMDCPIGTVRSRIFRAREAVDKVLQPLLN